jgi:hypothetical protein
MRNATRNHAPALFLAAGTAVAAFAGTASRSGAALLVADNFDTVASGANINGRVPPTNNGRAWAAATTATATTTTLLGNGAGGLSGDSAGASNALIDLGAGYLSANKGVYSISTDITQPSGVGTSSWLALGFAQGADPTNNFVGNNGAPWVLFRLNGQAITFAGPSNTNAALTTATGAVSVGVTHTFRLDLDTTPPAWTLNGFVDGVQQDFNGATAGNTFVYASNPIATRYVGIGVGNNGAGAIGTFDNFSASGPVPEPATAGLLLAGGGLLAARRRAGRRDG